jgi:hypothetical protein
MGPARRNAATYTGQHKLRKTQTSMPRVGFEPTIPVFGRAKTCPLDRAATVIGYFISLGPKSFLEF